jgi:hypothetical protein
MERPEGRRGREDPGNMADLPGPGDMDRQEDLRGPGDPEDMDPEDLRAPGDMDPEDLRGPGDMERPDLPDPGDPGNMEDMERPADLKDPGSLGGPWDLEDPAQGEGAAIHLTLLRGASRLRSPPRRRRYVCAWDVYSEPLRRPIALILQLELSGTLANEKKSGRTSLKKSRITLLRPRTKLINTQV